MRLNLPLIRPTETEMTSDQTTTIWKWQLTRPSPDRSDFLSNFCALEPNPRTCNFGLGTHRVLDMGLIRKSLASGTSTWGTWYMQNSTDPQVVYIFNKIRRLSKITKFEITSRKTQTKQRTSFYCCQSNSKPSNTSNNSPEKKLKHIRNS